MTNPEVWIVIHDDHTIEAFDFQDAALNSARDDASPYIECVLRDTRAPQRPSVAPLAAEPRTARVIRSTRP